jgi:hypothetical protein
MKCPVLVVSFLLTSVVASSQTEGARISGRVTDPTDAVIVGAACKITNIETSVSTTTTTNQDGIYVIPDLRPAIYRLTIQKQGFRTVVQPTIQLYVQDAVNQNFRLAIGSASEISIVWATEPLLQTDSAVVSTVVDQQFVQNMPLNGRSFQSLIELTPGVVITPESNGQFSVNGQRTDANYFTVDGVSANFGTNTGLNTAGVTFGGTLPALTSGGGTNGLLSVDAMQEFRIQTSSYAPEFGRSPGAQISIVTRGGTNQWHGTAFDYLRNDIFDARNYFDRLPLPKPPVRQNDFGGTFGGPVWKNHTFFFFSYESLRLRLPQIETGDYFLDTAAKASVPSTDPWQPAIAAFPTGPAPLPDGSNLFDPTCDNVTKPCQTALTAAYSNPSTLSAYSLRLDHQLANKITLFVRYNNAPSSDSVLFFNNNAVIWENNDTVTAGLTASVSPTLVNDFRGNWSRNISGQSESLQNTFGAVVPPASSLVPPEINTGSFYLTYFMGLPGSFQQIDEGLFSSAQERQLNFVDTLSKAVGPHQLKFGVDYRRIKPTELAGSTLSMDSYSWTSFLQGTVDLMQNQTADTITAHLSNWSLFGQDTWKATRHLTLTYGMRWEISTPPVSDTPGKPMYALDGIFNAGPLALVDRPLWNTDYSAFAPRVGAAFQVNPTTVLRGGFGMFYDLGYGTGTGNALGAFYPYVRGKTDSGIPLDFNYQDAQGVSPYRPLPFPNPVQLNASDAGLFVTAVDPNLRLPVTYQWNAAIERALGKQQSITVTYVGANGRKLLFDQPLAIPQFSFFEAELNAGISHYNALQLQFMRRMSHGLQASLSYSYSHSNDTASAEGYPQAFLPTTGVDAIKLPPLTPSDYDYHQRFSAAVSYNVSKPAWGGRVGQEAFNGWALDGIYRYQSVPPLDVTISEENPVLGFMEVRPVLTGQPIWIPDATQPAGKALNPAAFMLSANGASNNALRNTIRSPYNISQADLALRRRFNFTEHVKLDARAEYFNIFNHPMFGGVNAPWTSWGSCTGNTPASCVAGPDFGKLFSGQTLNAGDGPGSGSQNPLYAVGGPRSAQFTLKLMF